MTEPDFAGAARVLVITARVPSPVGPWAERRTAQVLAGIGAATAEGALTLMAQEAAADPERAAEFQRVGVEVLAVPQDWEEVLQRRRMEFTHVVATDLAALRRLDAALWATQPQAVRVLCPPSLPFRDVGEPPAPGGSRDDAAGHALAVRLVEEQVAAVVSGADAVWCATERDRSWVAGIAPGARTAVVPTAIRPGAEIPFERRSGYVVLAVPGADIAAGHEDAAVLAARRLLPELLARDPNAFLRVVVDDPVPALQMLAGPGVELVAAGPDPARWVRRSRVCLAWYPRGSGAAEAMAVALDARTPFVAAGHHLADAGLGQLAEHAAAPDPAAAALAASRLYRDPVRWAGAHDALQRVAGGERSPAVAGLRLVRACADVGIAPRPGGGQPDRWPAPGAEPTPRPPRALVAGSAWSFVLPPPGAPPAVPVDLDAWGWDVNEQYRRWLARYGPTPERLARLRARLSWLVRRPTFSVVMPVFNTEPSWLDDAISSVRAQVYPHWELCIADDGSSDPRTVEVYERHAAEDERVRVVRLFAQQGIAGASNAALASATGEFVAFLDHDDLLKPHALAEVALLLDERPDLDLVYSDEDKLDPDGTLSDPFFKPDWSPDHLTCRNYVCHLLVLRRVLVEELGGFRLGYDGSQDHDLVLRATERTDAIAHVGEPLYTWRKVPGSTAAVADAKPWAFDAARRALADALVRRDRPGRVEPGLLPASYRVRYEVRGRPLVSILIPTRDKVEMLRRCVGSVLERSTYRCFEFVLVDNQSTDPDTLGYLASGFPGRVVRYPHRFNYARMMNLAAREAAGDLLLFLNNDTEVITPGWLEALIEHAQRPEVGVVGPRLRYLDGRPQHEGTIIGFKGGHAGNVDHRGFWGMGDIVRNCSAVTGACLMTRPSLYWRLGGLDERLHIAWNDVDFCLRTRQAGHEVVYTPYAELFHVEGGTRGIHAHVDDDTFFEARWFTHRCLDPYYSRNFERLSTFQLRP
ncbi:MAG TPA: glycosyltransferase family 2 protein [Acidimicrobiales bacterium]|nr:glycosyltransferase family 2 protein [Acidimicrobiales bacterium]